MNHLLLLFFSFVFISLNAFGSGESDQHKEERHSPFYPKKPADKSLSTRPGKVQLIEPKAFSKVSPGQATLKWEAAKGAESYKLQVATDPNFKWLIVNQNFINATQFEITGLETGHQYFWRVYGVKADNEAGTTTSFPSVSSFEVQ